MSSIVATTYPAAAGPATRIAARVLTLLQTAVWVFFGFQFFGMREPIEVIHGRLGYPLYIIPFIGVTHILGGLGLLIPNRPRLTEWVYAGLTFDLLLSAYSHIRSGGLGDGLHPIVLFAFLMASYILRRRAGGDLWSSRAPRAEPAA